MSRQPLPIALAPFYPKREWFFFVYSVNELGSKKRIQLFIVHYNEMIFHFSYLNETPK